MKAFFQILIVLLIGHFSLIIGHANFVLAQNSLQYPIADLGNCRDARECYLYCQIPENKAACWSYATYKAPPNVLGVTSMSNEEKQQMESKAKQLGFTFPIADLGNCAGPQECRDFCEVASNHDTCMNFAKKKGFAKKVTQASENIGIPEEKRQAAMISARTELGCTSMESCRTICEQDHAKCEAFAQKHGFAKGPSQEETTRKADLLKKAGADLGCTSMESCRAICEKNPSRCIAFAKKNGFDQGNESAIREQPEGSPSGRGPSGRPSCADEESCKKYCQEHPNECPGFQGKPGLTPAGGELQLPPGGSFSTSSGGFVGPTGCKNDVECKAYCQANPTKCPGFPKPTTSARCTPLTPDILKCMTNNKTLDDCTATMGAPLSPWCKSSCVPLPRCLYEPELDQRGVPRICATQPLPPGQTYCPKPTPTQNECTGKPEGVQCSIMNCPPCPAGGSCIQGCPAAIGSCLGGKCVIQNTKKTPPPGCTYSRVQCTKEPCDPILVCPTTPSSVQPSDASTIIIDSTTLPQSAP